MTALSLPPLFSALDAAGTDPFALACAKAREGCDAGLVTYALRPDVLRAAIVFAPETPLRDASVILPVCAVGFQNAFGAIAPPEVSIHLDWDGGIRVNGGVAGHLRVAASTDDPDKIPDWMVVGLELAFWPAEEDTGNTPDVTALLAEGCGDVEAPLLVEAWTRHSLVWINRWLEEGPRPVHKEWSGLAHGLSEEITQGGHTGTFIGVDENFGMLLQTARGTTMIPLTQILTETA